MTFKLSPHDKFPKPTRWTRTTAIEAFGVTYLHDTDENEPIREVLGRREPHPWEGIHSVVTAFATDGEAVGHACALARDAAEREIEGIDAQMRGTGTRFRLALARNWKPARDREVGLLATESILDRRRRQCMEILDRGVRPEVRRLPEGLRMPIVLPLGIPVHIVDMRGFPEREVGLREASVLAREFVEAKDHPGYDLVPRYRIEGHDGTVSYDQDELVHKTFEGTPDGLRIFLLRAHALAHIHDFSSVVQDRLVQSLSPVIDLSPRRLPAPPAQAELSEMIPQAIAEIDEGREADVLLFPVTAETQAPEEAIPEREIVEFTVAEVEPATEFLLPAPLPPEACETQVQEEIPEPKVASVPASVVAPIEAIAIPLPDEVDAAFRQEEPAVPDEAISTETDEAVLEERDLSAAMAAVELAIVQPLEPVTVDDEFTALLAEPSVAVPELRVAEQKSKKSMLSWMSSIFERKASSEAIRKVEPVLVPDTVEPSAARTFVDDALDFANSEAAVELAPVPERRAKPVGEIESFLARGGIEVIRPRNQREADSLGLTLIANLAPELLAADEETIAA